MNLELPVDLLEKWQKMADLMAELLNVPAALIMKTEQENMEVFVASRTENNPFEVGEKEKWDGLYCETVIKTKKELLIPNALKDKNWDKNPDIKLGMYSYLGYPINYPNKTPFGTICVHDSKENNFTALNSKVLLQFKDVIENDLSQLVTFENTTKEHGKIIREQQQQLKDANRVLEEKVKKLSIHEKKIELAAKKLEANEIKLRAILDHRFQFTGLLDINGRVLVMNKIALELIGMDESKVIGQNFWDLPGWDKTQIPELRSAIEKAAMGEFLQFETIHKDSFGSVLDIDFSLSPVRNDAGEVTYIVPEGRDITEKKRMDIALHNSEEKFFKVFNSSPIPISIITLPEGKHVEVNPMYEKITGYKKDEILGKSNSELGLCVNSDNQNGILQKLKFEGKLNNFEILVRSKSGEIRYCRLFSEIIEIQNESFLLSLIYDDTDRKKAEESESRTRTRYKNLVEMLPEVVFETDENLNLTYINPMTFDLLGYSNEDIKNGIHALSIIAPVDKERAMENLSKRLKGIDIGIVEYMAVRKDGSLLPILLHSSAIFEDGKMMGLMGIVVDISEHKRVESELLESGEKFEKLFELANDGILILKDNKIVECNSKGLSMFGFNNKSEILGLTPSDLSPETQADGRSTKIHEAENLFNVSSGKPQRFGWRHSRPDGSIIDTEVSLNTLLIKDELHVQAVIRDVSERKRAEVELKESDARFKRLFEDLGDAVYVTKLGGTDKGRILEANPAAVKQTGYSKNELLELNIIEDIYVRVAMKGNSKKWESRIIAGETFTSVQKKVRKDGSKFWSEVIITPILFKGEKACLSINRDITQRVRAEKNLKKALLKATESDRLKSAFLASMSHEIRTPLNAIIGFSNVIADSVKDPELKEFSILINKQNDLLLNLVNDILEFARVESGELEIVKSHFNMNAIIDELFLLFCSKATSELTLIPQKRLDPVVIYSDENRIKQVFSNLLTNAFKFTSKGTITFGYRLNNNLDVVCFVQDTGIGIAKEQQEKTFDRFVKLDSFSQGAGLGLPISKNIMRLLQGSIWVKSEPNIGSTFYFAIPVKNEGIEKGIIELPKIKHKSIDKISNLGNLSTILIVEDDLVNFLYVKKLLESPQTNIVHASNGLQAVEYVKVNDNIDLIFMDIKMPVMDGYEATRLIKQIKNHLPIIALTAYALPGDELKAKEAGCNDYLSKPIVKEDLFALIYKYFTKNN